MKQTILALHAYGYFTWVAPYPVPISESDEPMLKGAFRPDRESMKTYEVSEWFRNAKFGIRAQRGPQCVEGSGDWMARSMYIEGSSEYKHHVEHYGHPSEVGRFQRHYPAV